jgi:hypothetical protein
MCVGFKGLLFFYKPLLQAFLSSPVAILPTFFPKVLLLLMETTSETKLLGLWQNGMHPFFVLFWLLPQSCFSNIFPI